MKALIFTILAFIVAASASFGQWGGRSCAVAQSPQVFFQAPQPLQWRTSPEIPDEAQLYRGGVQIGSWCFSEQYYLPIIGNQWGQKQDKAPIAPPPVIVGQKKVTQPLVPNDPEPKVDPIDEIPNFGVEWDKIADHQATYQGRVIPCDKAIELIGKQVPDDSKKFRLTIIGTDAEHKEALLQFASLEPEVKDRFNTWAVGSDHWSLKDGVTGQTVFNTKGNPVLYVQAPDGQVLHRQDDPKDLPQAIRKAVKNYDQTKDPDLRKPSILPTGSISPQWLVLGGLAAAALFFYMRG
jgi:hypothetical protein